MTLRLLLLASCLAAPLAAAQERSVRDEALDTMAGVISAAVVKSDTNAAVFHGSYDWHSAVHGHWALLRIHRLTGRHGDAAAWVDASLARPGLRDEARVLEQQPRFEMPYGRAWLLRLAIEHELWSRERGGARPRRMRPIAALAAKSLVAHWRRTPPSPTSDEYESASWALAQMYAWARHAGDAELQAEVEGHVRRSFLGADAIDLGQDRARPTFFSRFAGWSYLVATVQGKDGLAAFLSARPVKDDQLAPIAGLLPQPHHLGMNWSRALALRTMARLAPDDAERGRLERAFAAHVKQGLRSHERFVGDYYAYDHWVPQFAVYALTDGDSPPAR